MDAARGAIANREGRLAATPAGTKDLTLTVRRSSQTLIDDHRTATRGAELPWAATAIQDDVDDAGQRVP